MSGSPSARLVRFAIAWNAVLLVGGLTVVTSGTAGPVVSDPGTEPVGRPIRSLAADVAPDVPVDLATTVPVVSTPPPTSTPPAPTTTPPATTPPTTEPPTTDDPATTPPDAGPAPAPSESSEQRVRRAYETGVPSAWHVILPARLEVIAGSTSWARGDDTIFIARSHVDSSFEHLVDVVAHEYGHLIAFRHGTGEYPGAAPAGWPSTTDRPAEAWADCVQTVFTGRENPSHGLRPCRGESLSWARSWLEQFPGGL